MKKNVERQIPKTVTDLLQLVRTGAECFGEKDIYVYQENKQEKHLSYRENYERVLWFGTALCHYDLAGKKIAVVGDTHPSYMTAFLRQLPQTALSFRLTRILTTMRLSIL